MSKIDTAGPAFPTPDCSEWDGELRTHGMTLRDWFAGQAHGSNMEEAIEWYNAGNACDVYERAAKGAYKAADAMIAEKRRTEGGGA